MFRKRSVSFIWLVTYMFLLLLSIISSCYVLYNMNNGFDAANHDKNIYFLNNICANIDRNLSEINYLSFTLQEDPMINELSEFPSANAEIRFEASKISNKMSKLMLNHSVSETCFVYFPILDLVITPQGFLSSSEFYNSRYAGDRKNVDEWRHTTQLGMNINTAVIYDNDNQEHKVYEFLNVVSKDTVIRFIVGVSVKKERFFEYLNDIPDNNNYSLSIIKKRNDIFLSSDESLDQDLFKSVNFGEAFEFYRIDIDNRQMNLAYVPSSHYDYKYVFMSSNNFIMRDMHHILIVSIGLNCFCILLMLLVMVYSYRWNYSKIKDIISLYPKGTLPKHKFSNEYQIIKEEISMHNKERNTMEKQLYFQKITLRNVFLVNLLKGYMKDREEMSGKMKDYDIHWSYDYFAVLALDIKNYGIMDNGGEASAAFAVKNIINDMPTQNHLISVEMEGMIFYIINTSSDDFELFKEDISTVFSSALDFSSDALGITFTVAVSSIMAGADCLPELYSEALRALEYTKYFEVESTIFFNDLEKTNASSIFYDYSISIENSLIMNMKACQTEECKRIIDKIMSHKDNISGKWIRFGLTYNIINSILKSVKNPEHPEVKDLLVDLHGIEYNEDIGNIKLFLYRTVEKIAEINRLEDKSEDDIYTKIKSYINKNFMDIELNVTSLGFQFNKSSLYLSKIFKEHEGVKLSKYISCKRIEHAKELLKTQPGLKIDDVAKMSGFDSRRTFLNVFKEHVGIAPSQFRDIK